MRSVLFTGLLLISLSVGSCSKDKGHRPSLEDAVKRALDPSSFQLGMMDTDASIVFVAKNGSRKRYDADKIENVLAKIKASGIKTEMSHFQMLNSDQSGQFCSITYKFDWSIADKQQPQIFHLLSHEIWERETHGWRRLYAAIEE